LHVVDYLRFLAALAFVLGLIALLAWAARRFRLVTAPSGSARRLAVIEVLPVDPRRKLVLARCDAGEYLLLLGQDGNRLIERRSLPASAPAATAPGETA
jgi:flagellar protein FliO/FliZ